MESFKCQARELEMLLVISAGHFQVTWQEWYFGALSDILRGLD